MCIRVRSYVNRPVNFSIGGEVRKAAYSIQNLIDGVEAVIEDEAMRAQAFVEVRGWGLQAAVK